MGLGNTLVGVSKLTVKLKIRPRFQSNNNHIVEAIVVNGLTSAQPIKSFKEDIQRWDNHCLADPLFYRSDRIDMVIGVEIFSEVVQPGVRKCGKILGQATTLGWILSGVLNTRENCIICDHNGYRAILGNGRNKWRTRAAGRRRYM